MMKRKPEEVVNLLALQCDLTEGTAPVRMKSLQIGALQNDNRSTAAQPADCQQELGTAHGLWILQTTVFLTQNLRSSVVQSKWLRNQPK
jgi:hypothetical protein